MNYEELHKLAEDYSKSLRADDSRLRNTVIIHSTDCMSSSTYENAFVVVKDDWYAVFTEHYGFHLFQYDECNISMYTRIYDIPKADF